MKLKEQFINGMNKSFTQETGLIARHDNPEYMNWLESKFAYVAVEVLNLLNALELERDEDSCMGMTYITGHVPEDLYYSIIFALEKLYPDNTI
jgi:hypothetical protein